jgi:hypothetical protein
MLVRCYGSLELCPETIQGRIVEIETLSMTEEWRNRLRYLGHIPVSKQFQIMEIALTEPELDFSILEEFKGISKKKKKKKSVVSVIMYWFYLKNVLMSGPVDAAVRIGKKDVVN